ncbi:MAG TPA: type II secretion system F family protein [Candidatus Wolfebacteria bacterium]|nr:type II secretion system F family protein [Candidatus Wolfebacteria bacterium]
MRFHYIASQPNGKIVEDEIDAQGPAEVLEFLANKGLKPVSLKQIKGFEQTIKRHIFGQTITIDDKVFLTKYLALMLKVGTDLFKAINILIADFDKPSVKALLIEIRNSLEKGQPFYTTFAKYPKFFSPVFVNLIKSGEASGNLEQIFEDLSNSVQKEQELRNRIKAALTYPIILLVVSTMILVLLVSFALPRIANIFMSSGFDPPTFSKIVFAVGLFFGKFVWIILGVGALLLFGNWFFISKTLIGKRFIQRLFSKTPVVKTVIKRIAIQRFATTLASLLKAGLPITDSLEITAQAVGFEELKDALLRISREGIIKGATIGEAFKREPFFPKTVSNLVAISEKAGHIENILGVLAHFYESEIDSSIKSMVSFLEPVLLLVIGFIIGLIALSIIVPIYQLVGQF